MIHATLAKFVSTGGSGEITTNDRNAKVFMRRASQAPGVHLELTDGSDSQKTSAGWLAGSRALLHIPVSGHSQAKEPPNEAVSDVIR